MSLHSKHGQHMWGVLVAHQKDEGMLPPLSSYREKHRTLAPVLSYTGDVCFVYGGGCDVEERTG